MVAIRKGLILQVLNRKSKQKIVGAFKLLRSSPMTYISQEDYTPKLPQVASLNGTKYSNAQEFGAHHSNYIHFLILIIG